MRLKTRDWFALLASSLFLGYAIYSFQNPNTSSENVANIATTVMQKFTGIVATAANAIHIIIN
ncbi:hypothetical protein J2W98_003663 [Paenibacillus peoriae]|jgi:hypothetical protein|uniref:Uncharacterized protein n=1 Tax=Paenibacillus peoriae TaxID=59893 RepID=A0ABU1QIA7_9BACL|nr:hypothetical protein [Paenibacillus peoriae]MDR6779383.1 hypothetical protein [Paenibacillus peoriae]